jgi:hypothetical protein
VTLSHERNVGDKNYELENSFLTVIMVVVMRMQTSVLKLTKSMVSKCVSLNYLPIKITYTDVSEPTCAVNGMSDRSRLFSMIKWCSSFNSFGC